MSGFLAHRRRRNSNPEAIAVNAVGPYCRLYTWDVDAQELIAIVPQRLNILKPEDKETMKQLLTKAYTERSRTA